MTTYPSNHPHAEALTELDERLQRVREKRRRAAARLDKLRDQVAILAAEEQGIMGRMVRLMADLGGEEPGGDEAVPFLRGVDILVTASDVDPGER